MSDQTMNGGGRTNSQLKNNLLGCLEAALFMPSCARRFSSDMASMKKSFLIPLMVLPLTLATVVLAHPHADITAGTQNLLMVIYSLRVFISLGLFLTAVYFIAKGFDRLEGFNQFVTAHNWLAIPATVIALPLLLAFMNGVYAWEEIYPLLVVITLYSYAYTGFMITFVLRVPWEFATSLAVLGLAIHQTSLDVLKWVAIQTVYLVS